MARYAWFWCFALRPDRAQWAHTALVELWQVSETEFVKFWKRLTRAQRTLLFKTDAPAKETSMESLDMSAEDRYQALLKAESEERLIRECKSASLDPYWVGLPTYE